MNNSIWSFKLEDLLYLWVVKKLFNLKICIKLNVLINHIYSISSTHFWHCNTLLINGRNTHIQFKFEVFEPSTFACVKMDHY